MLAEILSDTLNDRNFEVTLAYDGAQALALVHKEQFDVLVTDIMMPNMDGYTFVKKIRQLGVQTPVLFLTARSATEDVVKGFELGGNDYLKKPFAIDELIVRIRALAARNAGTAAGIRLGTGKGFNTEGLSGTKNSASAAGFSGITATGAAVVSGREKENRMSVYKLGECEFNPAKATLVHTANGTETKLAARESAVLAYLCRSIGETVETSEILKDLWGDDNFFNLRSLNVYITRLRGHLKGNDKVEIISTRGVGYRIEVRN